MVHELNSTAGLGSIYSDLVEMGWLKSEQQKISLDMDNKMKIIYPSKLNKGLSSNSLKVTQIEKHLKKAKGHNGWNLMSTKKMTTLILM